MPIDHDPIHNFLDRLLRSKKKHRERTPRNRSRKRKIPQKKPDTHIYGERSVDGSPFGTTDVFSVWFSNERRDAIEQRSVWSIGASATRARMGYVTWARASAGAAEGRESVDGSGVECWSTAVGGKFETSGGEWDASSWAESGTPGRD
ncbi:hypothetical protein GLAREA_07199 [Glarea lozoyensis ATCC 20868]|uniref:Uncharacterized protein n=1 Tax=Glarea lozoyensis (strain ATCC 20868 / MF5171) TaxID=1116229 RepID=S3DQ47_GLAL2|nr:uncharacterized protein GLAREA_07199 [Glarea lozoyensis ATCC 20868]EPE34186.1 hypothetical protein GLAREA_07199 [Glarea lozoyensis ATCC 20868]